MVKHRYSALHEPKGYEFYAESRAKDLKSAKYFKAGAKRKGFKTVINKNKNDYSVVTFKKRK